MMLKRHIYSVFSVTLFWGMLLLTGDVSAKELPPRKFSDPNVIGEAFGKGVTESELGYYLKTAALFSRTERKDERTEEEVRIEAWHNMTYRHGAEELGIKISREELEGEIKRLVGEKGVTYGTAEYKLWTITQLKDEPEVFEKRIEDLLLTNKLLKLKGDAEVVVTEEDIKEKFYNQYNSFESEYIRFESAQEAEEFLGKLKVDRSLWKKTYDEKKSAGQKGAAWINIMSMEALIDLWKIPKEDAYRIHGLSLGDFTVAKFFYGDAVFRLLQKKEADPAKFDDQKKEYYRKTMEQSLKMKLSKEYFDDLFARAALRDYVAEDKQTKKVEDMKEKSILIIKTGKGDIKVKLFPEVAPLACENFIGLAEKGYYNGLIFHRVIRDFMIQGGDPTGTGSGGESMWKAPFVDETSDDVLFDKPGILAMANSGANTNQSQFFITTKPTPWLNKKHTIFGEVIEGLDVVKAIEGVPVGDGDKPKEDQKILEVVVPGKAK